MKLLPGSNSSKLPYREFEETSIGYTDHTHIREWYISDSPDYILLCDTKYYLWRIHLPSLVLEPLVYRSTACKAQISKDGDVLAFESFDNQGLMTLINIRSGKVIFTHNEFPCDIKFFEHEVVFASLGKGRKISIFDLRSESLFSIDLPGATYLTNSIEVKSDLLLAVVSNSDSVSDLYVYDYFSSELKYVISDVEGFYYDTPFARIYCWNIDSLRICSHEEGAVLNRIPLNQGQSKQQIIMADAGVFIDVIRDGSDFHFEIYNLNSLELVSGVIRSFSNKDIFIHSYLNFLIVGDPSPYSVTSLIEGFELYTLDVGLLVWEEVWKVDRFTWNFVQPRYVILGGAIITLVEDTGEVLLNVLDLELRATRSLRLDFYHYLQSMVFHDKKILTAISPGNQIKVANLIDSTLTTFTIHESQIRKIGIIGPYIISLGESEIFLLEFESLEIKSSFRVNEEFQLAELLIHGDSQLICSGISLDRVKTIVYMFQILNGQLQLEGSRSFESDGFRFHGSCIFPNDKHSFLHVCGHYIYSIRLSNFEVLNSGDLSIIRAIDILKSGDIIIILGQGVSHQIDSAYLAVYSSEFEELKCEILDFDARCLTQARGILFIGGSHGVIEMFEINSLSSLGKLEYHDDAIEEVGMIQIADVNRMFSISKEGLAVLWDLDTRDPILEYSVHKDAFLFRTCSRSKYSPFWTNNEQSIQIGTYSLNGGLLEILQIDDDRRINHMKIYNDRRMVMANLNDPIRYKSLLEIFNKGGDTNPSPPLLPPPA